MCIVFMSNTAPGYKLVLAANRDEFYDRPASQAAWHGWDEPEGDVLSGIDLSTAGGGTWLGMTRDMRIGVLTNIRPPTTSVQPPRLPTTPSRGALLKRCLEPGFDMEAFLATPNIEAYEGFNALFLQPRPRPRSTEGDTAEQGRFEIGYLSNKPPQARTLQLDGSRGLSNTTWDEPWPKVLAGQVQVDELVRRGLGEEELIEGLFTLMSQSIPVTSPADAPRSIRIPTVLIQGREYGTRVTTVILVTDRDEVTFVEQTWLPEGLPGGEEWRRTFRFQAA